MILTLPVAERRKTRFFRSGTSADSPCNGDAVPEVPLFASPAETGSSASQGGRAGLERPWAPGPGPGSGAGGEAGLDPDRGRVGGEGDESGMGGEDKKRLGEALGPGIIEFQDHRVTG